MGSKISHKRAVKNYNKSEVKISKHIHRSQSQNKYGHIAGSRNNFARYGMSAGP